MDVTGAVRFLFVPITGVSALSRRRPPTSVRFSDEGHAMYYASCAAEKRADVVEKKRSKAMKGLEKNLVDLRSMGFSGGAEAEAARSVSEAAEILLSRLVELRVDDKEARKKTKKKMKMMKKQQQQQKEEGEVVLEATKMKDGDCSTESSSSESSDSSLSSDSGCENETETASQAARLMLPGPAAAVAQAEAAGMDVGKIEVCMGGKCKRSGSAELMEEFRRAVGVEDAVIGCKCMGKCEAGPNVRVLKQDGNGVGHVKSPLCIGVGLPDVGKIVAGFFNNQGQMGALPA